MVVRTSVKLARERFYPVELKYATEIGAENIDRCRDYAGANTKSAMLGTFPGIKL